MRTRFDVAQPRRGTAGDRVAMRQRLTNPAVSAIWGPDNPGARKFQAKRSLR